MSISISLWEELRFIAAIFHDGTSLIQNRKKKLFCEMSVIAHFALEATRNPQNRASINKYTDNQSIWMKSIQLIFSQCVFALETRSDSRFSKFRRSKQSSEYKKKTKIKSNNIKVNENINGKNSTVNPELVL